jgi:peptide/nickel transport system permease protein
MARFILRRLAIIPPALLLVHFLGFSYAHLVRPLRAQFNPFLASVTKPSPLLPAYGEYIGQVFRLDLGTLPGTGVSGAKEPFLRAMVNAGAASLGLLVLALTLSVIIGVFLGTLAARNNPPIVARWLTSISTVGLAMPTFFLGSLYFAFWFLYIVWFDRGVFPLPISGYGWDKHIILPTLVLMARPTVHIAQVTSGLMVEELNKQYVVAARSIGHTWRAIRQRYAMRNILAAVIAVIAGSVRLLVGELIVVEWLFDWPGLGSLLARTLIPPGGASAGFQLGTPMFLNPPVVAVVITVFAALFLLTDLTAAILAQQFDPRLRDS